MRKNMKRLLCGLLAAALLIPAAAAAPASGQKAKLSDIQGHWAERQIEQAVTEGWVDGYPDGSFDPDDTITQAEFTKLLLAAFQLTPDSDTVAWMKSIAAYPHDKGGYMDIEPYTPTLSDMKGHWLTKQGWLDAAIYSGNSSSGRSYRRQIWPGPARPTLHHGPASDPGHGLCGGCGDGLHRRPGLLRQRGNSRLGQGLCEAGHAVWRDERLSQTAPSDPSAPPPAPRRW